MSLNLPEDLKHRVAVAARLHGVSEDDYMREAIEKALAQESEGGRPRPRWGQFASDDPSLSTRVDDILADGLGER